MGVKCLKTPHKQQSAAHLEVSLLLTFPLNFNESKNLMHCPSLVYPLCPSFCLSSQRDVEDKHTLCYTSSASNSFQNDTKNRKGVEENIEGKMCKKKGKGQLIPCQREEKPSGLVLHLRAAGFHINLLC